MAVKALRPSYWRPSIRYLYLPFQKVERHTNCQILFIPLSPLLLFTSEARFSAGTGASEGRERASKRERVCCGPQLEDGRTRTLIVNETRSVTAEEEEEHQLGAMGTGTACTSSFVTTWPNSDAALIDASLLCCDVKISLELRLRPVRHETVILTLSTLHATQPPSASRALKSDE